VQVWAVQDEKAAFAYEKSKGYIRDARKENLSDHYLLVVVACNIIYLVIANYINARVQN